MVVAGLLFLALAYLAVGQASVNRSDAQTAADAAALAAAQDRRDQLAGKWVEDILDPTKWGGIFDGTTDVGPSCGRAEDLAARNDATASCASDGPLAFTVEARTEKSVGRSVVPGTEGFHSTASARAVIEALCSFDEPDDPPSGDPSGDDPPGDEPGGGGPKGDDPGDVILPELVCRDGRDWILDPNDLTRLPKPEDLFDVHLAD